MNKKWKKGFLIGSVIGVVAANALYGLSNVAIYKGMHPKRLENSGTPLLHGMDYEDVEFFSRDGILLKGWRVPSLHKAKGTVIFSHGYGHNRSTNHFSIFQLMSFLHKVGYNILAYDFRNAGESEGSETTIAQKEQLDVLGAVDYVKNEKEADAIVLMGWSMGASASLLAGVKHPHVKGIIADSPFAKLDSYLLDSFTYWTKMPRFLAKPLSFFAKINIFGFKPHQVNPIHALSEMKDKKILIIHAKNDPIISCRESEKMKKEYPAIQLWQPEEGEHIGSYQVYKHQYEKRVLDFLTS